MYVVEQRSRPVAGVSQQRWRVPTRGTGTTGHSALLAFNTGAPPWTLPLAVTQAVALHLPPRHPLRQDIKPPAFQHLP